MCRKRGSWGGAFSGEVFVCVCGEQCGNAYLLVRMESNDELLLCNEDMGSTTSTSTSPCLDSVELFYPPDDDDESAAAALAGLLEAEPCHVPDAFYCATLRSQDVISASRSNAVHWMMKVRNVYGFSPLTVALSVSYFDRYLSKELQHKTWKAWMIELLSVACVSLAAKMEEPYVPMLQDLQIEGLEHLFESKTIQRMEVTVMKMLDWRMKSVTSFAYVGVLLHRLDITRHLRTLLLNRINELLMSTLSEMDFLDFSPSLVALSATICALEEAVPLQAEKHKCTLSKILPVEEGKLDQCYRLMEELVVDPLYPMVSSSQVLENPKADSPSPAFHATETSQESGEVCHEENWKGYTGKEPCPKTVKRKLDDFLTEAVAACDIPLKK